MMSHSQEYGNCGRRFRLPLIQNFVAVAILAVASSAWATHIPTVGDVPFLRPDVGRYLEFINPTEHPGLIGVPVPFSPPGLISSEEFTGFTTAPPGPIDIIEFPEAGAFHTADVSYGDRADFDWVQENRAVELAGGGNHPGPPPFGAMGWTIGVTEASPHLNPVTGVLHGHSVAEVPPGPLPELLNPDYAEATFGAVDVFSVISIGEDSTLEISSPGSREAALDYELAFGNSITGLSAPGVPVIVWVPGWTFATSTDDWVTRWVPAFPSPGGYNLVAIEPASGFGHDEVTEIDAIKAIPEPSSMVLAVMGALGLMAVVRRRRK